jgi:uncharacterized protein (TIGR00297 family)
MPTSLFAHAWASSGNRFALAVAVTLAFALLARAVRGVDWSGAVGGGLVCFSLFAAAGPAAFATLTALFILTWLSTRAGYRRKQELGVAEHREGRKAGQVLANLAASAVAAGVFAITGDHAWVVAAVAALSEAATDTVASEIGQSRKHYAHLITTWKVVSAGVDGGVTLAGTLTGAAAGIAIVAVATACGLLHVAEFWIPAFAGFAGMLLDSFLGATIQRRGWISNRAVNFVSTLAAASLAFGIVAWRSAGN